MADIARLINVPQSTKRSYYQQRSVRNNFPAFAAFSLQDYPEVKAETTTKDLNTFSAKDSKVETDNKDFNVKAVTKNSFTKCQPIPLFLVETLQQVARGNPLPLKPSGPLNNDVKVGLDQVVATLNAYFPPIATRPARSTAGKENIRDILNELAIANWKRIFAAGDNTAELEAIATELNLTIPNPKIDEMAGRLPLLSTSNLPQATSQEAAATASPARGTAMLNSIFKSVRVPEFRFKWQFWAEKGQQSGPGSKSATAGAEEYASRPKPLGDQIISVKEFYQHFNNIPVDNLKLRDSIHLFHVGIKPLWEDPRNARGGAYYFRIPKEIAPAFWHEICLLAVGDILQTAVETKRESFNDDICGISYSVRWNAVQVAIWNRDANNEAGKEKLLQTILEKLSKELQPKKDAYWYKPHKEHRGFAAPEA